MYKLVVVDVDGTLTDSKGVISSHVVKALERLREKKLTVILASGNGYPMLVSLAYYLPVKRYVIAENGGVVGFSDKVKILGDPEKAYKARGVILSKLSRYVYESWQNRFRIVDLAFQARKGYTLEFAYKKIMEVLGGMDVSVKNSGWAIHVVDAKVNKGRGLMEACKDLNVRKEEVIAIGDSETDIPLFEYSGYSIAVNNSPKELKDKADVVVNKSYSEGFIEAIKLIEKIIK
ncbi:MAG TPA: phosphoglycolate phosphatase [Thermofilum sp.]|nr:phosphoglycolate phosphatase [Thermofilum sp.]